MGFLTRWLNFGGGKVLIINILDYRMHLLLDFEN